MAYASDRDVSLQITTDEATLVTPYRGITYTTDDIRDIRRHLAEHPKRVDEFARQFLDTAEDWLDRGIEGLDELIPPDGAVFAYGTAGDPKTGQAWHRWGRAGDMCSLDRPYEVRSPHTGEVYGNRDPDDPYYDPGDGWVDPETGQRYYFKGVWHAYASRQLHELVDDLAIAYMLTGDERIARLALHLLDHFAGFRKRNPDDNGRIDHPHDPPDGDGFMGYNGNQANMRMAESAIAFDLLGRSEHASEPSVADSEITVAQNILENYFDVLEPWQIENRNSLQNHATAAFVALLAKGRLIGEPENIEQGIDATLAFLDNTINRDGDYYEVSGSYGQLGRRYGGQLVALLMNYSPDQYDNPEDYPDPADYPHELNFGRDLRWYATTVSMLYEQAVLGRYPNYGNHNVDRDVLRGRVDPRLEYDRSTYLSFFYNITDVPEWREEVARRFHELPEYAQLRVRKEPLKRFGATQWLLPDPPAETGDDDDAGDDVATLQPAKGIAILRSGEGEHQRALFMRGGVGDSHAQDDQMALILYGAGMLTTGRYGYNFFGNPDHIGWSARSISHKMVVVNEDRPGVFLPNERNARFKPAPVANITAFMPGSTVQMVEMSNPGMWAHLDDEIEEYRRTAWLVDVSDEDFYFLDMFHVEGGHTHDYPWHSPYLEPKREDDGLTVEGVELEPHDEAWVLAALRNTDYRDAFFNHPEQSWGERVQGHSGEIRELPGEELGGQSWWNPPPENGYGMIWNIHTTTTDDPWQATWLLHDEQHYQRLNVVNFDGMEVIRGHSPVIDIAYRQSPIIARRQRSDDSQQPLQSRFVTLNQISDGERWPVRQIDTLALDTPARSRDEVGVRIALHDERTDYALQSRTGRAFGFDNGAFDGRRGFARFDQHGGLEFMMLHEGRSIEVNGWRIELDQSEARGTVRDVTISDEGAMVSVDQPLPQGGQLEGSLLRFARPRGAEQAYGHDTVYRAETVRNQDGSAQLAFDEQSLIETYIVVEAVDTGSNTITATFPNELMSEPELKVFDGKRIAVEGEPRRSSRLVRFISKRELEVADASRFEPGDRLAVHAIQRGDTFRASSFARVQRTGDDAYRVTANASFTLTLPNDAGRRIHAYDQSGERVMADEVPGDGRVEIDIKDYASGVVELVLQ